MTDNKGYANIINLRRELHQNPELSGRESRTVTRIIDAIKPFQPDEIITGIGGHGVAFIFKGSNEGKTILYRAELDALPIQEENNFKYKSTEKNIAHLCGHDGHMAILVGLAQKLHFNRSIQGKIVLLFQPQEETGLGAKLVVHDRKFINIIKPDYVFSLHNLPGFPKNTIVVKDKTFSSASIGLSVKLFGKSSHAAEPENGISPVGAITNIISKIDGILNNKEFKEFVLATIVYVSVGEKRYGTSPEMGELAFTLRAFSNDDLDLLIDRIVRLVAETSQKEKLMYEISQVEGFLALENHTYSNTIIRKAAHNLSLPIHELDVPFKWSEDFSWFTKKYQGALFGLGSGETQAALHNPDYDFPDEIIVTGVNMFYEIYRSINV